MLHATLNFMRTKLVPVPNLNWRRIATILFFQKREKELKEKGEEVSKPPYWGGYRVIPDCFEFWQGQTTRIHDRLRDE